MGNSTNETEIDLYPNYTPMQDFLVQFASGLSAITCFYYVISYMIFYKEFKSKIIYNVLYYYFLSNCLASIGSIVGLPHDTDFWCWFEGLVTNIFVLSAILWTIVLTYLLFTIIYGMKYRINFLTHLICWGIPLLVTFLPLMNSTYAPPGGQGLCWVATTDDSPEWASSTWFWVSFYIWIWIALIVIIILTLLMVIKLIRSVKSASTMKNFKKAIKTLFGYPLIILVCYLPSTILDYILYLAPDINPDDVIPQDYRAMFVVNISLMGFFSFIVLLLTESIFWSKWKHFYQAGFDIKRMEDSERELSYASETEKPSPKHTHRTKVVVPLSYTASTVSSHSS